MADLDLDLLDRLERDLVQRLIEQARGGDAKAAAGALRRIDAMRARLGASVDRVPLRAEALEHMRCTGQGYQRTARAIRPTGMDDEEFKRLVTRVKRWQREARAAGELAPAGAPTERPSGRRERSERPSDQPEEDFYAELVDDLRALLDAAPSEQASALSRELRSSREALDRARGPGRRVRLDRDPRAVAERIRALAPILEAMASAEPRERSPIMLPDVIDADSE